MKSKSYPIGWISAGVAVVIWLVATWFEDDTRWLPPEPLPSVDTRLSVPRADSELRTNTDALSCQQTEETLVRNVEGARYCATDDDCTLFDYGYPIQCLTSVAKTEISALRLAYRRYEQSCAYRVYYDCPSGEMTREAVCRNNRCDVDLVSNDPLEDETLRHLGIRDL